ncbi:GTP cyclohydrolase II [Candidatus Micrarchaeota archaeon]|nr:GTP cyclohydrolase II [Candidatus Micrarchaeota archaeon]
MVIEKIADAFFPTRYGNFRIYAFANGVGEEHLALLRCTDCDHKSASLPVRIHSRCLTGDALTSIRCDCRSQLEKSMRYIEKAGCGLIIYLNQEGRGIGLGNKIKAYSLQDQGLDTAQANLKLGFKVDERDFSIAADILKYFGISKIDLLTNNPDKVSQLEHYGISVIRRIPLSIRPTKYNKKYLETKKTKFGHLI